MDGSQVKILTICGLEESPCSVDLDGGQVEAVNRLSDTSVATRD